MIYILALFIGLHIVSAHPLEGNDSIRQQAVNATEFPYQILISQFEESPKCGGVLVSKGFLITSASCVLEFGGIKKFLEEAILYGGGVSLLVDLGDVADAVIHPKYTVNPTVFDVALVKYVPDEKGPKLNPATFNGSFTGDESCILTSWWNESDLWPNRLTWQPVLLRQCDPPETDVLCFAEENTEFYKNDLGSPIVCDGILVGLIPRGGGKRAINLTSDYNWIIEAMTELEKSVESEPGAEEDNNLYLTQILQKLDKLASENSDSDRFGDNLTNWNNQIVIPLSYVLFAMVIFFFVLLFFIILFTVVLVYYSRK